MAADAGAFNSQLPMYRIKPGYVAMVRLLAWSGVDPVTSVMLLSLIPGLLIILLLFVWIQNFLGPWSAAFIVSLFVPAARLIDISRVPVPDNFSALLLLLAIYGLTMRRWWFRSMVLLMFAITVRVNNIVFVVLLLSWLGGLAFRENIRTGSASLLPAAVSVALSGTLYLLITWVNDYQWWRLFYHTFVTSIDELDSFAVPFSLDLYLGVLRNAAAQLLAAGGPVNTVLPGFILIGLLVSLLPGARRSELKGYVTLFVPTLLVYLLMFPLVPSWDRFFTPFYGLIVVFACQVSANDRREVTESL